MKYLLIIVLLTGLVSCNDITPYLIPKDANFERNEYAVVLNWNGELSIIENQGILEKCRNKISQIPDYNDQFIDCGKPVYEVSLYENKKRIRTLSSNIAENIELCNIKQYAKKVDYTTTHFMQKAQIEEQLDDLSSKKIFFEHYPKFRKADYYFIFEPATIIRKADTKKNIDVSDNLVFQELIKTEKEQLINQLSKVLPPQNFSIDTITFQAVHGNYSIGGDGYPAKNKLKEYISDDNNFYYIDFKVEISCLPKNYENLTNNTFNHIVSNNNVEILENFINQKQKALKNTQLSLPIKNNKNIIRSLRENTYFLSYYKEI